MQHRHKLAIALAVVALALGLAAPATAQDPSDGNQPATAQTEVILQVVFDLPDLPFGIVPPGQHYRPAGTIDISSNTDWIVEARGGPAVIQRGTDTDTDGVNDTWVRVCDDGTSFGDGQTDCGTSTSIDPLGWDGTASDRLTVRNDAGPDVVMNPSPFRTVATGSNDDTLAGLEVGLRIETSDRATTTFSGDVRWRAGLATNGGDVASGDNRGLPVIWRVTAQ